MHCILVHEIKHAGNFSTSNLKFTSYMKMQVHHTEQCILGKLTVSTAADSIKPFKSTNHSYPLYCR